MDILIGGVGEFALGLVGGVGLSALLSGRINSWIAIIVDNIRGSISLTINAAVKDPELRDIAYQSIWYAQNSFAKSTGKKRLKESIKFAQALIPGNLDDAIVEGIIQTIYDGIIKPVKKGV